jgi:hypothetical protein
MFYHCIFLGVRDGSVSCFHFLWQCGFSFYFVLFVLFTLCIFY